MYHESASFDQTLPGLFNLTKIHQAPVFASVGYFEGCKKDIFHKLIIDGKFVDELQSIYEL